MVTNKSVWLAYALMQERTRDDNLRQAIRASLTDFGNEHEALAWLVHMLAENDASVKQNTHSNDAQKRLKEMILRLPLNVVEVFVDRLMNEWEQIKQEPNPAAAAMRVLSQIQQQLFFVMPYEDQKQVDYGYAL